MTYNHDIYVFVYTWLMIVILMYLEYSCDSYTWGVRYCHLWALITKLIIYICAIWVVCWDALYRHGGCFACTYFVRVRGSESLPLRGSGDDGIRREFSLCLLWRRILATDDGLIYYRLWPLTNKVVVKRNSLAHLAAVRCVCFVSVNNPWLLGLGIHYSIKI